MLGKTFIALAVIGFVLKMLHDEGEEIRLKQLLRRLLQQPCIGRNRTKLRMDAGGQKESNRNQSIVHDQPIKNFNANSQYFLANALETIYEGDTLLQSLIFDGPTTR